MSADFEWHVHREGTRKTWCGKDVAPVPRAPVVDEDEDDEDPEPWVEGQTDDGARSLQVFFAVSEIITGHTVCPACAVACPPEVVNREYPESLVDRIAEYDAMMAEAERTGQIRRG